MRFSRAVFRTDASLDIGTGHVVRCLTLADSLKARGVACHFVSRAHPGHMLDVVRRRGHVVHALPVEDEAAHGSRTISEPAHAAWLGCDWRIDAERTRAVLDALAPDLLVVDHYALDVRWEAAVRSPRHRTIVIDDLADRAHSCDLLVDQTLGRAPDAYRGLVGEACTVLAGADYAVLRPEFLDWRERSLARRRPPRLERVLVAMGGVDRGNATAAILNALASSPRMRGRHVDVVMGARAPWLAQVRAQARAMPLATEIHIDVADMARAMAAADLAIGAAGTTSWERCCLGLPTLVVVLADNQRTSAMALERAGAAVVIESWSGLTDATAHALEAHATPDRLDALTHAASRLVDGRGVGRVLAHLEDAHAPA